MKPRCDITLGEMQDECKFRGCDCYTLGGGMCDYFDVCESMHNKKDNFQSPCDWGLTDPPRFNEQQMALLKAWFNTGVRVLKRSSDKSMVALRGENDVVFGTILSEVLPNEIVEKIPLDLAAMFGKDGENNDTEK